MIPTDVLLTIAEIAIAVLGFAAIVTALRGRSGDGDLISWFRLRIMIESSFAALAFAFLPSVFRAAGLADSSSASLSSALLAMTTVAFVAGGLGRQRRLFGTVLLPGTRLYDIFIITSGALLAIALSLRAVGFLPQLGFAPYVACLLFFLLSAIRVFVGIVFFANHDDGNHE